MKYGKVIEEAWIKQAENMMTDYILATPIRPVHMLKNYMKNLRPGKIDFEKLRELSEKTHCFDEPVRKDQLKELEEWVRAKESEAVTKFVQSPVCDTYWKGEANMASMVLAKIEELRKNG